MGSWDETCALSHLPIKPGDPVRILYLTKNDTDPTEGYEPWSHYGLALPVAIRGVYDDYGRVASCPKTSPEEQQVVAWQHSILLKYAKIDAEKSEYHGPQGNLENVFDFYDNVSRGTLKVYIPDHYDSPDGLRIIAVVVREDVWQTYVKLHTKYTKLEKWEKLLNRKALAKATFLTIQEATTYDDYIFMHYQRIEDFYKKFTKDDSHNYTLESVGFSQGVSDRFHLWRRMKHALLPHKSTPHKLFEEKPTDFPAFTLPFVTALCNAVVDAHYVTTHMYCLRQGFAPTIGRGSQHHEWMRHRDTHAALRKIADVEQKVYDEEMGEYE